MRPNYKNRIWKMRMNKEIYNNTERTVSTMRKSIVAFYEYLTRLDEKRLTKIIFPTTMTITSKHKIIGPKRSKQIYR